VLLLLLLLFSYTAFIWDNDAGLEIYDQETDSIVGTENFIYSALEDNGIETDWNDILPPLEDLLAFDMLWINCAWRDDEMIGAEERKTISGFIDSLKPTYLEGSMVARVMAEVDSAFLKKFGVRYIGTDTIYYPLIAGVDGTFLQGEFFNYNPYESLNFNVDLLDTLQGANAGVIYGTEEPTRIIIGRGIGAGFHLRGREDSTCTTVFGSLSLCGLQGDPEIFIFNDRDRREEFVQKILGFFGYGNILVVDDNESNNITLQEDLDAMGVRYDVYDYDTLDTVPDSLYIRKYNVVLWTTGFTDSNTVTLKDQWVIDYYLQWGGRVILAGEGIGSDIGYSGQGEVYWFLELFGTDYISDAIRADSVIGVDEYDGIRSSLSSPGADSLTTVYGGKSILEYFPSHTPAGIKKEEVYNPFKTTFLGFAYEGMKDIDSRSEFLRKTIAEFDFNFAFAGVTEEREENLPETTASPNPFTFYTVIPTRSKSFEVYSITGRFIKRVEGEIWYGRDKQGKLLPSGIYFFRSNSGERGKVILVR